MINAFLSFFLSFYSILFYLLFTLLVAKYLYELGRKEEAIQQYKELLSINPDDHNYHKGLLLTVLSLRDTGMYLIPFHSINLPSLLLLLLLPPLHHHHHNWNAWYELLSPYRIIIIVLLFGLAGLHNLSSEQVESMLAMYDTLEKEFPKNDTVIRLPLNYIPASHSR